MFFDCSSYLLDLFEEVLLEEIVIVVQERVAQGVFVFVVDFYRDLLDEFKYLIRP